MKKMCFICGSEFDEDENEDLMENENIFSYNIMENNPVCVDCFIKARIEGDSLYQEVCQECGSRYIPLEVEDEFEIKTKESYFMRIDEKLCLNCALKKYKNYIR